MVTDKYIELITKFVNHTIDVKEFEVIYLDMFKKEQTEMSKDEYLILDSLFSDVDMFCPDSDLFEDGDLTESDLLNSAKRALKKLIDKS